MRGAAIAVQEGGGQQVNGEGADMRYKIGWYKVGLAAVVGLLGCGPSELGESCEADDECVEGLICFGPEEERLSVPVTGGGSASVCGGLSDGVCSKACDTDVDCASVGAAYVCTSTGGDCPKLYCAAGR